MLFLINIIVANRINFKYKKKFLIFVKSPFIFDSVKKSTWQIFFEKTISTFINFFIKGQKFLLFEGNYNSMRKNFEPYLLFSASYKTIPYKSIFYFLFEKIKFIFSPRFHFWLKKSFDQCLTKNRYL